MKILHTISGLGVNSGGPSSCTYNLLLGLNKIPIDAHVLTYDVSDKSRDRIIGNDSFIHLVDSPRELRFAYSRQFTEALRAMDGVQIYHINGLWQYPSHIAAKVARRAAKPYIIAPHGMLYPQGLATKPFLKKTMMRLYQLEDIRKAACLQATCEKEMYYIRELGIKNPVAIIPNALNISSPYCQCDSNPAIRMQNRRIGFIGRLDPIKNLDILINAWARAGKDTNWELVIIGDGNIAYKNELINLAKKLQIKNILFAGFLVGDELRKMRSTLSYLVLPSKSENFGMVVPEALIEGIPVIASKGTPWEELNINRCGWWIENDLETVILTLQESLELSDEERAEMGKRGRQLVYDNYIVESVALKMKELYEWILGSNKKPSFVYTE